MATESKFLAVGSGVPWAEPEVGAVATQSYANPRYGPDGLALLRQGLSAEEVVRRLTEADDGRAQTVDAMTRQLPGGRRRSSLTKGLKMQLVTEENITALAAARWGTARDPRLSGRTAADAPALFEELGAGGTMNGTVHSPAAEEGFVRGVDDGVNSEARDVSLDGFQNGQVSPRCRIRARSQAGSTVDSPSG